MRRRPGAAMLPLLLLLLAADPEAGGEEAAFLVGVSGGQTIAHTALSHPTNVFVDEGMGEIYVGSGRYIHVLNVQGILLARLDLGKEIFARRVAVDRQGILYVLDPSSSRGLKRYDLFGERLGELELKSLPPGSDPQKVNLTSFALDGADNLYLLDEGNGLCYRLNPEGKLEAALGEGQLKGYVDMDVSRGGDLLAFLSYDTGKIRLYQASGQLLKEFGGKTGGRGGFSQPVAISMAPDGRIFALDRNRAGILIFGNDGLFLGEFGDDGEGGGFYFPSDLYIDSGYHLFVADTANRRIQLLEVTIRPFKGSQKGVTEKEAD